MRILMNNDSIIEIGEISITPCYENENSVDGVPWGLYVSFDCEYIGEYLINEDMETYEKAMKNYKSILESLLVNGYCKDSDFKNFEFY